MEVFSEFGVKAVMWLVQLFTGWRGGKVVIDCLHCKSLRLARRRDIVTRDYKGNLAYGGEEFVCTQCKRRFNSQFFEADADGVTSYASNADLQHVVDWRESFAGVLRDIELEGIVAGFVDDVCADGSAFGRSLRDSA